MNYSEQMNIFDVFERDWKESKVVELLEKISEHCPKLKIEAVFIFPRECGGAEPAFATYEKGKYKLFNFWHGTLNLEHFILKDELPNDDWIKL